MHRLSQNERIKSQSSIRDYMTANHIEHCRRFQVQIQIKRNKDVIFDDLAEIFIDIETNFWNLEIDFRDKDERKFHPTYRDDFQKFRYKHGNLIIYAKDLEDDDIEIIIFKRL